MRRPRASQALLAILVTTAMAGQALALGRTPAAFECQGKVANALAKFASKQAKCLSNEDDDCLQDVTADATERLQGILEKAFERLSLDRCMPGVCGAEDTIEECAASILSDLADPETGRKTDDFRCLGKTTRLFVRLATNVGKCRRDSTKARAKGRSFDFDGCVDLLIARNLSAVREVLGSLVANGSTVDKCVVQNLCTAEDDIFACAEKVLNRAADQAQEGGAGDSKGTMERAADCRENVADMLLDVTEAAASCREEQAKKTERDESFDLDACLQRPIEKMEARVANLLAKVLDKGVTPDLCIPGTCTAAEDPFECATDAVNGAAGL